MSPRDDYRSRVAALTLEPKGAATAKKNGAHGAAGEPPDDDFAPARPWPAPPAREAFAGILGEIVELVAPHVEPDPAAILLHLLVCAGNAVGKAPHFRVGAGVHHLNLFGLVVGATSTGGKGSAWEEARNAMRHADPAWSGACIHGGLGSGEGLIKLVRDPVTEEKERRGRMGETYTETVTVDPGASDKRCLVIETEFRRTMAVMAQKGSTLSTVLRQAWDGDVLEQNTKNTPIRGTDAHVSVIGHITPAELRAALDLNDVNGGLVNRFLIGCARIQRFIPSPATPFFAELRSKCETLARALDMARHSGELRRTPAAEHRWAEVYESLRVGKPGLLGALTVRAAPQVMRLACLYAVLDGALDVDVRHLESALALWRYCEESAVYVFGDTLADQTAERILAALKEAGAAGLSRRQINEDVLGRHKTSDQIRASLMSLSELGWAHYTKVTGTGGRARETWFYGRAPAPPSPTPITSLSSLSAISTLSECVLEGDKQEAKKEKKEEREEEREEFDYSIEERLAIREEPPVSPDEEPDHA